MQNIKLAKNLLRLLEPYPWALPLLVGLGLLATAFEGFGIYLFVPLLQILTGSPGDLVGDSSVIDPFLSFIMDVVPPDQRLPIIVATIVLSIALKNLFNYANVSAFAYVNARVTHQLRSSIFNQILAIDYKYFEQKKYGAVINTLETQTWNTSSALSIFAKSIIAATACVVLSILLWMLSWKLTIFSLFCVGLISLIARRTARSVKQLGERLVDVNTALSERMWETLSGLSVVRAFGREAYEQRRYDGASREVSRTTLKLDLLSAIPNPLSEVLAVALLAGLIIAFGRDQALLATLVAFVVLLYRLLPKARELVASQVSLSALAAAVDDVTAMLDRSDKPYIESGPVPFRRLERAIVVDGVTFRYRPDDEPALRDVSIRIPRGRTTALVGPSGAGKSTLINILCRFYDVDAGKVHVDDVPLRQLNLVDWRSRIAIVSQDVHLFNATIRDNVAYGRLDASDDDIVVAARLANAHGFIEEMPQGYATSVGERGVRLSGGQRQRIALARAIIRDPDILILDEATNALDSLGEQLIQDALDRFGRDRTMIVIAHRLSTIERADQIVVLDHGRVVEQGDLPSLLRAAGLFARLYRLQHRSVAI